MKRDQDSAYQESLAADRAKVTILNVSPLVITRMTSHQELKDNAFQIKENHDNVIGLLHTALGWIIYHAKKK